MNITATLNNGQTVNIVAINVNGSSIYISYVDGDSNLRTTQEFLLSAGYIGTIIATNATIIS
jgi:hypothetical protein